MLKMNKKEKDFKISKRYLNNRIIEEYFARSISEFIHNKINIKVLDKFLVVSSEADIFERLMDVLNGEMMSGWHQKLSFKSFSLNNNNRVYKFNILVDKYHLEKIKESGMIIDGTDIRPLGYTFENGVEIKCI